MFSLHESTQRRVCRIAFVACAVVPTLVTLLAVVYCNRPWRETDWQHSLGDELHVRAAVNHVETPRPGVTRLRQVQLTDLRSDQPLGSCDELLSRWHGGRLVLSAQTVEVDATRFSQLATTLATWLSDTDRTAWQLQANEVVIRGPGGKSLSLKKVRLQTELQGDKTSRLVVLASLSADAESTLKIVVDQQGHQFVATLDTDTLAVPTWLLADQWPTLAHCRQATFTGLLRWESGLQRTGGSLHGRIDNLSLAEWAGAESAQRIEGTAEVVFDQLQWTGPRVEQAHGRLRVTGGVVTQALAAAVVEQLFCRTIAGQSFATAQPFDELSCAFHLTDAGLTVTGKCDAAPGCLMSHQGRPILLEPRFPNLPVAQLVRVLARSADGWLPATRQAHSMAGKLPLPDVPGTGQKQTASRTEEATNR